MVAKCVFLGAGAPHQGQRPAFLDVINGSSVLDWLLQAFQGQAEQFDLMVGYQSDDLQLNLAQLNCQVNPDWRTTGSASSLLQADFSQAEVVYACYGDILVRPPLVAALADVDAPVVVAWDSHWKQRYLGRDQADLEASEKVITDPKDPQGPLQRLGADLPSAWAQGEFIGLVRFSGKALDALRQLQRQPVAGLERLHLSGLVEWLRVQGMPVAGYDVAGDWAEVNHPGDIAHFVLGTKAETLARLRQLLSGAVIQDQVAFTAQDWQTQPQQLLDQIHTQLGHQPLVVRSSARSEDAFTHSNAGAYTSRLNVEAPQLQDAIIEVLASYADQQPDDQVLVQPMVQGVCLSGVIFTRTLEHGAPWWVVNYEDSGATDGITSGQSQNHQTLYLRRDACPSQLSDARLAHLIRVVTDIERLLGYDALDIEFAIDQDQQVHILQVRPIAVEHPVEEGHQHALLAMMDAAVDHYRALQPAPPHLLGDRAVFGIMPDWNPAEIIGTHPNALAMSLYRYLILDETWAQQRADYGYRDVRPAPLLVDFAGTPFIDVRASFNSFIPKSLDDSLAAKLVNFYLEWLCQHPELHDKVEFDVLPTCLGLDFARWETRLSQEAGLTAEQIQALKQGLLAITQGAVARTPDDLAALPQLEARFAAIQARPVHSPGALMRQAWLLLEDCRLLGTLPFAHLARSGFIAVTLLKEAVAAGVLSESAREDFMSRLTTVSHELSEDASQTAAGRLDWADFISKYGHLRPGTYDITSKAYHDDPDHYLRPLLAASEPLAPPGSGQAWAAEKAGFFAALRDLGLEGDDAELEGFLRTAIEGREQAKFIFSRNLSASLDTLRAWGQQVGLKEATLANLTLNDLLPWRDQPAPDATALAQLQNQAQAAEARRELSHACELPALITAEADLDAFIQQAGQPNFIGRQAVQAPLIHLEQFNPESLPEVAGCLVMIPQADPGFDWLFGQGIAGLITLYGGANSHMAIRAAEFGLPAAIGIGEPLYRDLARATTLELDPLNASIRVLH